MSAQKHWNHVYETKQPEEVSWYSPHLDHSLKFISEAARDKASQICDIGAGESTLVDDLLDQSYVNISALDISDAALAVTKKRLGMRKDLVTWYVGDITSIALPESYFDVWHDRAVFHFLTEPEQRAAYIEQVKKSVKHGGRVIVAAFGPNGPLKCSGLDVVRYDPISLHGEFGGSFELVEHAEENHVTPWGTVQQFVYCYCKLL